MSEYVQAISEASPASVAVYEATASRIAGECPSVLAGAPQKRAAVSVSAVTSRTARQEGEAKRQGTQLGDLQGEIEAVLTAAEDVPLSPVRTAFLAKLKALPSGDPVLTQFVRVGITSLEEEEKPTEAPDACADMKAWVGSGYMTLSPASRTFALNNQVRFIELFRHLSNVAKGALLTTAEGQARKELVAKTVELEAQVAQPIDSSISSAKKRLDADLGLNTDEHGLEPLFRESKSAIRIGSGRTAVGTKYTVWVERHKGGGHRSACKVSVEAREAEGSNSEICVSGSGGRSVPQVQCSEGLLTIQGQVLPATRTTVLSMSNGKQIVSRPTLVPRRLGGPAAFYYQVVRGPSPAPISLIERDAQGRTLRVARLARIVGCSKRPLKYLPGGKRTLVRGQALQGRSILIVGERYRLFGRVYSRLTLKTGVESGLPEAGAAEGIGTVGEEESFEGSPGPPSGATKPGTPLDSKTSAGCQPHEYSIFYGLLSKPEDTVLAKVEGKLMRLRRVHIPASIHAGGVLVYLVSAGRPEETVVRAPSGKTVMSENHVVRAHEGRETCEGESEGASGPPPGDLGGLSDETSRIMLTG